MKKSVRQRRVRRSESQIKVLLKEKDQSNVTVKEFCERNEISEATFYNWRNRCAAGINKRSAFIPVRVSDVVSEGPVFAEIEYRGRVTVRLLRQVDPSWLKALLPS
jgi:hypothetical protein